MSKTTKKLTAEEFIKRAKEIHGNKYDYSLVDYKNSKTKVKIICPIHGVFEQIPSSHLNKNGCSSCKGLKKLTAEEFIKRAKEIHGNKYDYSLVDYKNSKTKVKIICPIHGVFEQIPNDHLCGSGCSECSYDKNIKLLCKNNNAKRITIEEFQKRTNCKYQIVDNFNLKNTLFKCKKCGNVFVASKKNILQRPELEWCKKCSTGKTWNKEKFIEEAKKIHGDFYDYSKVNYIKQEKKVEIICPKHGSFFQTPRMHIHANQGCPKCSRSIGEEKISLWLKRNNILFEEQKTFNDCFALKKEGKRQNILLRYDFFIPTKNLLIEYNGIQHYKPVDIFGGKKQLKEQRHRDWLKRNYAKKNNYKLLTIPYWNCKIIEEVLEENL